MPTHNAGRFSPPALFVIGYGVLGHNTLNRLVLTHDGPKRFWSASL